jgi:ethanolamine utilization protein EutQ
MSSRLFTAEDIRRLAREKKEILMLAPADILTQEAADTAYALGIRVLYETTPSVPNLPSLKVVHLANVQVEPFLEGEAAPGTNVWWKQVIAAQDRSPLTAGYMSLDKGEVRRTLVDDEIDIVLEGEVIIRRGDEEVRGKTGDVIYLPRGSNVTLSTLNWARFVYVTFPTDRKEK